MRKITLVILCFAILGCLHSCKKKDYVSNVSTKEWASTDEVFKELSLQPTVFTVDGSKGGYFRSASSTRYLFYPNSFKVAGGGAVTGQMEVKVYEYLQKGDMIFSRMVPKSDDKLLVTTGEVNIAAVYNGQSVDLKSDSVCVVSVPTFSVPVTGMQLFVGKNITNSYFTDVNWTMSPSNGNHNIGIHSTGIDSVNIITDKLNLISCARIWSQQNLQTCTLTVRAAGVTIPDASKVMAYAIFTNANSIMGIEHPLNTTGNGAFFPKNLPMEPLYFVVFTVINGKFYGGTLNATPKTGETYEVMIKPADAVKFRTQLNQLL